MHNLPQISCIDVAEDIAPPHGRIGEVAGEILRVFVRFDDVADAQGVDVRTRAPREGAGGGFVEFLGQAVAVHRVDVVVVFFDRQEVRLDLAIREADAVGRFTRRDNDLVDPHLCGGFDDVVGANSVHAEGLVVRLQQDARDGGEVHDGVEFGEACPRLQLAEIGVRQQRIEHGAAVGDVGLEVIDARMIQRHQIDVQHLIALVDQPRHNVTAGLA